MKPWYRSVTIWSALVAVLGLIITRLASGKSVGEIVTDPEVQSGTADLIGFLLSALGAAGVLYGRVTASSAIAPSITGRTDDESGRAGLPLVAALATLALVPLLLSFAACGPRMVVAEQSVRLDVWPGPPCLIRVEVDGELVARVDWTKRCDVGAPPAHGAGEVTP